MVSLSSMNRLPTLVYVEVKPCIDDENGGPPGLSSVPSMLAAAVKVHLLNLSCTAHLLPTHNPITIHLDDDQDASDQVCMRGKLSVNVGDTDEESPKLLWLPHLDPNFPPAWPCECYGFMDYKQPLDDHTAKRCKVLVTEETVIRVLPPDTNIHNDQLTGELPNEPYLSDVIHNHNSETRHELLIRLKRLVAVPITISTSPNKLESKGGSFGSAARYWMDPKGIDFNRDGALLLHSPDRGAGKTTLVEHLIRNELGCSNVHTIQFGPLFSKYGVYSDMALETILHQAVLSAALRAETVCIILDNFPAMMPPAISGTSSAGDSSAPILSSIASYLRMLTYMLYHHKSFPFPTKNPLYNVHGSLCRNFPVQLYFIAIATCPDDGWLSSQSGRRGKEGTGSLFNALEAARYRLPPLKGETRLKAFRHALEMKHVAVSEGLQSKLPYLASSAVWARGIVFSQVASIVCQLLAGATNSEATEDHFVKALNNVRALMSISGAVVFSATDNSAQTAKLDAFSSIGGNQEAKIALEEAIAADEGNRLLLRSFGMKPPTGVLLYGPPGTGKTLCAKAVATMLKSSDSSAGGGFVSISSTDIARAEIGSGEKLLASAFETAKSNAPAVVFIDEFQALFTDRSNAGAGRLTSTLMALMDDCGAWADVDSRAMGKRITQDKRVIVLAATNTPWMIDYAFMRTGRFDRIVHVGLPNEEERKSILKLQIGRVERSFGSDDHDLEAFCQFLAESSHGFSGADLAALCRSAAIRSLLDGCKSVQKDHFMETLDTLAPSSDDALVQRLKGWRPV